MPQLHTWFPGSVFQILLFSLPVLLIKETGSSCSLSPSDASLLFLAHYHLLPLQLFLPLQSPLAFLGRVFPNEILSLSIHTSDITAMLVSIQDSEKSSKVPAAAIITY